MKDNQHKGKAPAFQLYADDFIAGTSDMTAEEVGGFIRLLCHQWSHGSIPADQDRAARIAGLMGSPCVGYVLAKFSLSDGHTLKNARLESVREEQQAFRAKQAAAGLNGAKKRWAKWPNDGDPNGNPNGLAIATPMATPMATAWPDDSSPSPSPNNKEEVSEKDPWEVKFGLVMPEKLRAEECMAAVQTWLAYKSERKQPYKRIGLSKALEAWANDFNASTFPAAVNHSIANNYQGIFAPRAALAPAAGVSPAARTLSLNPADYQ